MRTRHGDEAARYLTDLKHVLVIEDRLKASGLRGWHPPQTPLDKDCDATELLVQVSYTCGRNPMGLLRPPPPSKFRMSDREL